MENSKLKFILASASPRRRELIGHLGIPFEVVTLNVPEDSAATDPIKFSQEIAMAKGDAVCNRLFLERPGIPLYVVSADTIVCHRGKIYGKPTDRNEAERFLNELSGNTHSVFTAVTINLLLKGKRDTFSFVEESRVTFNKISSELMKRYLASGDSTDKAGAYGIQGPSLTFISKVEGDYANVVGFPLSRFVIESENYLKSMIHTEATWLNLF